MSQWSGTSEPVPPSLVCSKFPVSHHPRASGEAGHDIVVLGFRNFRLVEGIDFVAVSHPQGRLHVSFSK